ncbi:MAG: flagellar hook-length control protein FliK [Spirochaetes bacterium]|nr:flagellar hook-length control protein FliK [Spirochaetota bacterium]
MINFSEILKNRRSEELPEPKNPEKGNDAFASLFAESVKNASDALTNNIEKTSSGNNTENTAIEAKEKKNDDIKAENSEMSLKDEVKSVKFEELKPLSIHKENAAITAETAEVKKSTTEKKEIVTEPKKESKKSIKTEKENTTADPIADTLKTANNILLSILNKSTAFKPAENKTAPSENINPGAKNGDFLAKNTHGSKAEANAILSESRLSEKNEKLISDLLKDNKFISKDKVKDAPVKKTETKETFLNETEAKQKIRVNNKTDQVKIVKAAENSASAEISKKNDINLNIKIGEETQTVSNVSSANKKETNDGNFFSFDKNSSNIRNDREFKAEINTASKTPFADQLKDIINNSRINVRNDKNADITIKMNPENLGDMRVKMEMENGIIKANFTVATEEAKELLLQNIEELKNSLSSGGISIGEMKVSVKNENNGENRNFVPEKNIIPDVKESTAVYSAEAMQYDGHLNLVV